MAAEGDTETRGADARRHRSSWVSRLAGVALTVALIVVIELLLERQLPAVTATALLALAVVFAANRGGILIGLACAGLAGAYLAHVAADAVDPSVSSTLLFSPVAAALFGLAAIIVGYTRARLDRKLRETERERQSATSQLEGALRDVARAQSEVRLQSRLLDEVGQAVVATDGDGRVVYVNGAARTLFGHPSSEMIGRPVTEVAPVPEPETGVDDTLDRLGRNAAWMGEAIVAAADGPPRPMLVTDAPLLDDAGRPAGMVRVLTDLSLRRKAERSQRILADAGAVLSASLDYASTLRNLTAVIVPDLADACLIDLLDETGIAQRLYARHVDTRLEPLVRTMRRRYPLALDSNHPTARTMRTGQPALLRDIDDSVLRGVASDEEHLRILRSLGYRSGIVVALRDGERTFGALSMFRGAGGSRYDEADVRLAEELARRATTAIEHAQLYEQALLANRAKSDFLAVMSHELRTPLTTIIGYADLMLSSIPTSIGERGEAYVKRVRSAADHLLGLIDQILVYSRLELGRLDTQPETVSASDVIREIAVLVDPIATERGLDFSVEIAEPFIFETDLGKLRQILLNLATNAIKFTDSGSVEVNARQDGEHVEFTVTDTGIGIAQEDIERIFDPFWQVDQSSTRRVGGTGLGLTVSRRLARYLGGDIEVDSRISAGSTFRVRLPLRWGARERIDEIDDTHRQQLRPG